MRGSINSYGPPVLALGAVVAVVALLVAGGGEPRHRVNVVVPNATSLIEGQGVRIAGRVVGTVAELRPAERGRAVKMSLDLEDEGWPLRRGTKVQLRWGGTLSFNNRYVDLTPGPRNAGEIPENGTIPTSDVTIPVEFDEFTATFDRKTRAGVRSMLTTAGPAVATAGPALRRALDAAPPALHEGRAVLRDVAAERAALQGVVRSTRSLVTAIDTSDPGLRELVHGAAATFATVAAESRGLEQTLERTPETLTRATATLKDADRTLGAAGTLTDRIGPGIHELRRVAKPLNSVIRTIADIAPEARTTLRTARRAVPDLNPLLERLTERSGQLASIGRQATKELNCIRPYSPEIAGFGSTWGDETSMSDGRDLTFRAQIQFLTPLPANTLTQNSGQLSKQFPGLKVGFPRPPGYVAGQPWFLPECGAGPGAIDPFQDQEGQR